MPGSDERQASPSRLDRGEAESVEVGALIEPANSGPLGAKIRGIASDCLRAARVEPGSNQSVSL